MAKGTSNDPNDEVLRRLREAKAHYGSELLAHPDVHGIGIGYKVANDRKTKDLALVIHVYRKRPKSEVDSQRLLPTKLRFYSEAEKSEIEVLVDVREKPVPVPEVECGECSEDPGGQFRPVPGGVSGGLADAPGGTLGGWVWDRMGDQLVLISNEHVLGSSSGDTVIQPSIGDGGSSPSDDIGSVVRAGTLDVAIAAPSDGSLVSTEVVCSGPGVFEATDAMLEMEVEKVGRTTGLTCGLVELIDYDSGHYGSSNDLWISGDGSDFSDKGDSGSLYFERVNPNGDSWKRVVGIHWGGSGDDGIGHPIGPVLTDLDITTVCAGLVEAIIEALFGEEVEEMERVPDVVRVTRPRLPRIPERRSFARDIEARLAETSLGSRAIELMHSHRVEAVKLLLDGDGARAVTALLRPVFGQVVTTDELFDHVITERDLNNVARLLTVAKRQEPSLAEAFSFVDDLAREAEGVRLGDLMERVQAKQAR